MFFDCYSCRFRNGTVCDMCDHGGGQIISHHGKHISTVRACDGYQETDEQKKINESNEIKRKYGLLTPL